MPEEAPLITVIVATFNAAGTLQRCIDSVAGQTYPRKELIIMDGGSTDGTVEMLKANDARISRWESGRDRGIYHAFNKALDHAEGEWICFLGADDFFWQNDVLERISPHLGAALARGIRVVYGQVAVVSERGDYVVEMTGRPWEKVKRRYRQDAFIPHQGTMHHRTLFEEHGRFDESFRMAGDYDLLLRELKSRDAWFFPEVVAAFRIGGVSTALANALLGAREVAEVRRKNGIRGFSRALFRRRFSALLRLWVARLLGAKTTGLLIYYYRVLRGKARRWTGRTTW